MERLGLGPAVLRARNPRLIYASLTGYGATGPWVHRRAYATVVHAEAGLTKAQGEAREQVGHVSGRRLRQRPAEPRRRVHRQGGHDRRAGRALRARAHGTRRVDRRVDGRDDALRQRAPARPVVGRSRRPGISPQLRPGRLPRVHGGRRRRPQRQRPPGRAGVVRAVPPGVGGSNTSPTIRGSPTSRLDWPTSMRCATSCCRRPLPSPTPSRSRSDSPSSAWRRARCAAPGNWPRRSGPVPAAPSSRFPIAAAARSASPTRRGTSATPRSACAASRATAARTTGRCSPRCWATTTRPSIASRPTVCCRAGSRRHEPAVPGRPDEGDARHAADGGRGVGVRDQVGRLPHARLRRRRRGAAAELEPLRRDASSTRRSARWPPPSRHGGRSSTASSSCSTTRGGRASS